MKVIWIAMLISLIVYLFVGLYFGDKVTIGIEKEAVDTLRNILYSVSLAVLIAAKFVRKAVLTVKGQSHSTAPPETLSSRRHPVIARYTTAMVIALALSESVGIYGLILYMIGKSRMDFFVLILVSGVAMFYFRPVRDEVLAMAEEADR